MTASSSDQPHRYFFVHIPKTGGVSLRRRLMNHFGKAAVYPTGLDGTDPTKLYLSIDCLRERLAARGDQIRVITGHFPLRTVAVVGGRYKTLTLLRDPVERMLSQLRHDREIRPSEQAARGELRRRSRPGGQQQDEDALADAGGDVGLDVHPDGAQPRPPRACQGRPCRHGCRGSSGGLRGLLRPTRRSLRLGPRGAGSGQSDCPRRGPGEPPRPDRRGQRTRYRAVRVREGPDRFLISRKGVGPVTLGGYTRAELGWRSPSKSTSLRLTPR